MKNHFSKRTVWVLAIMALLIAACPMLVFAEGKEYTPDMYATFWSLVPPVVAIVLALITKEVYSSLFIGIVIGGLFYSGFSFEGTFNHVLNDGIISVLSDSYNVGILVFLVILGVMVSLMNRTGGSPSIRTLGAGSHQDTYRRTVRHCTSRRTDIHRRLLQLSDSRKRYETYH